MSDRAQLVTNKKTKGKEKRMMRPYIGQTVVVHAPGLKGCCVPAVVTRVIDEDNVDLSVLAGPSIGLEFHNCPVVKEPGGNGDVPAEWTLPQCPCPKLGK